MRIAAIIEYDGSHYYGFQRQTFDKLPTIQQKLEDAISKVADHTIEIIPAGRTDKGVHATGQVIHFDTTAIREVRGWILGINSNLPDDISIKSLKPVNDDFHARFSATGRTYQYLIYNARTRSALWHQRSTLCYFPLDENKMCEASQHFIGEHDFSAFRAAECQAKTPVRNLHYFKVERRKDFILLEVKANAFLHHMVRNIAGLLLDIGMGKKSIDCIPEILASRDRTKASITAPPEGLYLTEVSYP